MVGIFPHDNLFYLSSTLVESPSNNLLLPFKYPCRIPSNNLLLPFKYPVESPSNNLLLPFKYLVESPSNNLFLPFEYLVESLLTIFFYLSSTPLNCCYPSTSFCLMLIIISFVKDDKCGLSHPLFLLTLQN